MPENVFRFVLRDYLFELQERAAETVSASDFDRGYAMAVQAQLETLENKLETFGIDPDALMALDNG